MDVQINGAFVKADTDIKAGGVTLMITPPIGEDYWLLRVPLSGHQAIVGFPKFGTIGIGFQKEEDWNTNLPYTCDTETIFRHIAHNKGDETISDADCRAAIELVCAAARAITEAQP